MAMRFGLYDGTRTLDEIGKALGLTRSGSASWRSSRCPSCGAEPGQPCSTTRELIKRRRRPSGRRLRHAQAYVYSSGRAR
jgi:hypothetical protein